MIGWSFSSGSYIIWHNQQHQEIEIIVDWHDLMLDLQKKWALPQEAESQLLASEMKRPPLPWLHGPKEACVIISLEFSLIPFAAHPFLSLTPVIHNR